MPASRHCCSRIPIAPYSGSVKLPVGTSVMRDFLGLGVGHRIDRSNVAFVRRAGDEHHLSGHVPGRVQVGNVRAQILVDFDVGARDLDAELLQADPVGVADPAHAQQHRIGLEATALARFRVPQHRRRRPRSGSTHRCCRCWSGCGCRGRRTAWP